MKNIVSAITLGTLAISFVATGGIPNSKYQYAADGEYDDILLVSPWISSSVRKCNVEFKYPKWMENQPVDKRRSDTILFNGVIKLAGGNVIGGLLLSSFKVTPEFEQEMKKILAATDEEVASPSFVKSVASLAGRNDVLETGLDKVSGLNAFYSTTKMERRVGGEIIYRGVQRVYMIPLKDGKTVIGATYVIGALGVNEAPYADFNAFKPVGEKFIKSLVIKGKSRWKFW